MEDKNKKPVDKQELKKPTGKSATGKPLDGIEIRPQLKDLGQGQRNEDAVVLADTLAEKKALTLVQRQRRARAIRAKEPKMQRAKELAKRKLASDDKLKARAIVQARKIIKKRFASRRGTPYTELSTAEKIQVDTAVDKKVNLIKKLATRLLPRIRKMEFERLASFNSGAPLKNLAPAAVSEDINQIIKSLNNKSSLHLVDIINESIHTLNQQNDSMSITLKRMLHAVLPEDSTTFTIMKKAERTGIPFSTLREVFERGVFAWENDERVTQEQHAFSRVNSYIAKGKAWTLDADLREEKDVNATLDANFDEFLEACWSGYKAIGKKKKGNRMVPNCVPEAAAINKELIDRLPVTQRVKRRQQEIQKKIIDESGNTPYVKPHIESGQTKQTGWKASNKHGNVKYFGLSFKSSAQKHAGINEALDKNHPIVKEYNALKKHDIKTLRGMISQSGGVVDTSGFKSKDHAASHLIRAKHGNKKVDRAFGFAEDVPAQREVGTKSLVKKYQKDTPGQEKADLNESFNIEFAAGIGVGLTANECGIFIKPGFQMHPDVVEEDIERKGDFKMVKVRTPKGWAWRKVRREVNIEKDAE